VLVRPSDAPAHGYHWYVHFAVVLHAAHRPRRVYSRTLAQAGFGSMHGRLRHPFLTSGGRYIFRATK